MDLLAPLLIVASIALAVLMMKVTDLLRAVICLCGNCILVEGLFSLLHVASIMIFQILVYAGATVTLSLSAIMFTRRRDG